MKAIERHSFSFTVSRHMDALLSWVLNPDTNTGTNIFVSSHMAVKLNLPYIWSNWLDISLILVERSMYYAFSSRLDYGKMSR